MQNGLIDAIAGLTTIQRKKLHRSAWMILRNQEDAEDAVQEGLMRAVRFADDFRGDCGLMTWLYTLVNRESIMLLRARRKNSICGPIANEQTAPQFTDRRKTPEQLAILANDTQWMFQQLRRFSDGTKVVVRMRLEGETLTTPAQKTQMYRFQHTMRSLRRG